VITIPFKGMSVNEEGFYCLHGPDPSLLLEARQYLINGLRRWTDDESVRVSMVLSAKPLDLTQDQSEPTDSSIQPRQLGAEFQLAPGTTDQGDPPGIDISMLQQPSNSPPPTPSMPLTTTMEPFDKTIAPTLTLTPAIECEESKGDEAVQTTATDRPTAGIGSGHCSKLSISPRTPSAPKSGQI